MKIVCTVTNDLAQDQRMDRICTSLTRAGHQLVLVGRKLPASQPLSDKTYRQHRIPCRNLTGKRFYAEYNYRLWREIRQWDYDVVCSVDLDTLIAGVALTSGNKSKLVYDAHEWFSETPEVVARPLIRGIWRVIGKMLVPRTDARYTVGPLLARELEKDYGVPFGSVRNVPLSRRNLPAVPVAGLPPDRGRKVILYQGMFNPGRGLLTALNALADLPDCELWLVGDGPELGALRRCNENLGCKDRVWFAGFRSPAELPGITERAWLGLNLLDAVSPSYYFSLANKAFDYVRAGVPSVQMNFPEYEALAKKYGCYVLLDRLEPVHLSSRIKCLIDDPASYEALVAGCRRAATESVWEREEIELLNIWNSLDE